MQGEARRPGRAGALIRGDEPADDLRVAVNDMVLVQGAHRTRGALRRWNARPWPVLGGWFAAAGAVAAALLAAVLVIASAATPDPTAVLVPGVNEPAESGDVAGILARNALVLALHAVACVAGFIAGSSMPVAAAQRTGFWRAVHEKAHPLAVAWVVAVTGFSLVTQAYALGGSGADLAGQLGISPATLLLTVLPHALVELTALFLPLAAWTIASRRAEWDDLLAATVVTVAVAVPMLVVAASWETYVWSRLLTLTSPAI